MDNPTYFNRELSWLSFNRRVLQEAKDSGVPLYTRLKFLAIYSSNLDEFYRVRVASLRNLTKISDKTKKKLDFNPQKLLSKIQKVVRLQQEELGSIYKYEIIPALAEKNIFLINEKNLTNEQKEYISDFFFNEVKPYLNPLIISKNLFTPFLQNRRLYLALKLAPKNSSGNNASINIKHKYALVDIPSNKLPRFIKVPSKDGSHYIIFLDDIIRSEAGALFLNHEVSCAYSVKLSRDADLYLDDEFSGNLVEKINKSLKKREIGSPVRFLFDEEIPKSFLKILRTALKLNKEEIIPGGRYHNFNDFFNFPNPLDNSLDYEPLEPLAHKNFEMNGDIFKLISAKDILLHFPYQKYDYVLQLLSAAAEDPLVSSIKLTQYRVASKSEVVRLLIKAAQNGKKVKVFVEIKARFDEQSNLKCADEMRQAGVEVYYSIPGIKVHSKIAIITRVEGGIKSNYCYLATGNFNEKTALIYSDTGLITANKFITEEVNQVFKFLAGGKISGKFKHLLVAQFNMRKKFISLIDKEIKNARKAKRAKILLKLNSLEDKKMINKLYEASNAGVKINIIVRGICCLIPGVKNQSENIKILSIIDRFLEHSRIFIFHNGGNELVYAGSADWMRRNLNRRVEVIFPIYDFDLRTELKHIMELQLRDNTKARIIDSKNSNKYSTGDSDNKYRSQTDIYDYLREIIRA